MNIDTAIAGVLSERSALQQIEGLSAPTYISEHMYLLSQYISALEVIVGEETKRVELKEAELFNRYTKTDKKSVNAAEKMIKYQLAADKAELARLSRLCTSSWRFISVAQSRHKHLIEESKNQI